MSSLKNPEINWVRTAGFLTVVFKDKPVVIKSGDNRFKKAIRLIKKKDRKGLENLFCPDKAVESFSKKEFTMTNTGKVVNKKTNEEMHPVITKRLLEFSQNSLSYRALKKFWENLKKNPNKNSVEQLFQYLERYHFPITEDGCFLAYKYVTRLDNGKLVDSHSKTYDNSVGKIVTMDRTKCCSDGNAECAAGLHAAAYQYASSCGGGEVIVLVKINPKDVVSVPKDYQFQKMRTCKYEVLAEGKQKIEASYVKSKYIAGKTDLKADERITCLDTLELSNKPASEIIEYVFQQTGEKITLSLKSKKAILKKAEKILKEQGLNTKVEEICLLNKTGQEIIDLVKNKTKIEIDISLKNKKSILRKAKQILTERNFRVFD